MADALLVTTQSGTIKTVNRAAQVLFGYSEDELVGKSILEIIIDEKFLVATTKQPSLLQNLLNNVEVACQTKTGEKVTVAFSCSAIQTDFDDLQNFIYIGRDVTEYQRTQKRLAAQHAATRIMSESATLDEASTKILKAICENLEWDIGELWIPTEFSSVSTDRNNNVVTSTILRCVETWVRPSITALEFLESSRETTFALGVGLPGHIWASRFSYWIPDVVDDTNFVRLKLAAAAGLHGAFGFPIQSDGEVLGVMIFFSREKLQPDEYLLEVMDGIGNQLGQFFKRKQAEVALRHQREQTERLLVNILPSPIVDRLKEQPGTIAEDFADVTVMFADIVGFTELSALTSPTEMVELLNAIFSKFDQLAEVHKLEKIKTIGDAYMVVGGVPKPQGNHAQAIAEMALDMQNAIANFHTESGKVLSLRIGINTGPVVAGIIGIKKFSYDLWGDVVNVASRMESHGLAGKIQVTTSTYERLKNQYLFHKRGVIPVKGKGEMTTYLLVGRKGVSC
ncbi:MAG: PAS domain S-box protein [Microcoleus sp. SIO2G3]|nr:PAS domain S-box protein [Microcoleus sp. SIO2G3]